MPSVNILLSTYNGMRYLPELLQSLEAQSYPGLKVTIRDDCSTDGTYDYIAQWSRGRENVKYYRGERLGPSGSFFKLLELADDSEYYAFCDQDDVWLPDKLLNAVTELRRATDGNPSLYCSRVEYVDANLRHLGYSPLPKRVGFKNALVENVATGCTIVLDESARRLLSRAVPCHALMYDAWCYLTISACGNVIFDPRVTVRYRQHASNVLGCAADRVGLWSRRVRKAVRARFRPLGYRTQAAEFRHLYADRLNATNREVLERFVSIDGGLWRRSFYALAMGVERQSWWDNTILRGLILCGRV